MHRAHRHSLSKLSRRSRVGHAQHSAALVSPKLDLSGRMRGEHFVEPEIQIFVAKFIHERRQVNRASIVDARLIRHSSQRRDLNFASGQRLDVQRSRCWTESSARPALPLCNAS